MADSAAPVARSPIQLRARLRPPHPAAAGLTLADLSGWTKVVVRAAADGGPARALPTMGRSDSTADGVLRVGSGPGEWYLLADACPAEVLAAGIPPAAVGELVSWVDLTHGRAMIRMTGDHSASALAKLCAIDLRDRVTPDGAAFRSSLAHVITDVVRRDVSGTRSYLLHCERSVGQFLFDAVLDAADEFGGEAAASST